MPLLDPSLPGTPLEPGGLRRLGRYLLLRRLSSGGMADVYLAVSRSSAGFEKLVVIKCVLGLLTDQSELLSMLLHEGQLAAQLAHPNIVQVYDVDEIDGTYFIVMEYLPGQDVRTLLQRLASRGDPPQLPLPYALHIATEVCHALTFMHERRDADGAPLDIVHRDISPHNVVVTFDGAVKLVDFGVAQSGLPPPSGSQSGRLLGKYPYMSPEQIRGEPLDARSDVFALGIVLFEMTTGQRLFKAASEFETLRLISESTYPSPREVDPQFPPQLAEIIERALSREREGRYASAREMGHDLARFARDQGLPLSPLALADWMVTLFVDEYRIHQGVVAQWRSLPARFGASSSELFLTPVRFPTLSPEHPSPESLAPLSTTATAPTFEAATTASSGTASGAPRGQGGAKTWRRAAGVAVCLAVGGMCWGWGRASAPRQAVSAMAAHLPEEARPAAPPFVPQLAPIGRVEVHSDPSGASVWMDGRLLPERTPCTLTNLPLERSLRIDVAHDGYATVTREVVLSQESPSADLEEDLPRGEVVLALNVEPMAAEVWVDGKASSPGALRLSAHEPHRLLVGAKGYIGRVTMFESPPGEQKLDIRLERAAKQKKPKAR